MRTEIDITDDDPRFPMGDGEVPDLIFDDDNDVLMSIGEVTIRMTYAQLDTVSAAIGKFMSE